MSRLGVISLLLAGITCAPAQIYFSSSDSGEKIEGKPKLVRIERQSESKRSLSEETTYREDGNRSEHRTYREDGSLSYREVSEYDESGHHTRTTTFDDHGKVVRVQNYRNPGPQVQEEVSEDGAGKPMGRVIRKFNEAGLEVENTIIEPDKTGTQLKIVYDEQSRAVDARLTIQGENVFTVAHYPNGVAHAAAPAESGLHITIVYQGDKNALITAYAPDGSILSQQQTSETQAGRELSQVLFDRDNANPKAITEQIDSTDSHGNWTQKTMLERNPRTQVDEVAFKVYRTIAYY